MAHLHQFALVLISAVALLAFPPQSVALFYDFEANKNWEQINGTMEIEGGELIVSGSDGVAVLPDADWKQQWTDYTVEAKCSMAQGPDNMGVVVRYQDNGTYVIFAIMNGRQQAEIWTRNQGNYVNNLNFAFPNKLETWYTIRVVVAGAEYAFYIDDELIGEWEDDTLKEGKVGVRTYASTSHFDDIRIFGEGIPSSPGEPGAAVDAHQKLAAAWAAIKRK